MILLKGGADEPDDMRLPGKAGGTVAVRRTLASTICRVTVDLLWKSGEFPVSNEELDDTATTVYEGI
jgi:hypothetical protein